MANLSTNSYNIFYSTASGVQVYNLSGGYIAFVPQPATSSIWASDTNVYIGTSNSGIFYIPTSSISGAVYDDLYLYKAEPDVTNNEIIYLFGRGEYLCATTISGVDQYNTVSGTRIYTKVAGAYKCFQTTTGEFYYAISDELNAVYSTASNWDTPDYVYDDTILLSSGNINDIHVTEGTSLYGGDNVIFLATSNGAHIIEERKGDEANSRTKRYFLK